MFGINAKGQTILNHLLINPRYRILRHALLIMSLTSISFNQTFIIYQQYLPGLGNRLYWIGAFSLITYLIVVYTNIYILIPRYLMQKRYLLYGVLLTFTVFLLLGVQNLLEIITYSSQGVQEGSYFNLIFLLNYVSSFMTIAICLFGGSITILLKHWITENQRVNQLEKIHVQSEIEQLKDQINPQLLFNILNRTGILARENPTSASDMIMKLSQVLRYQLYDCSRKTVLLNAELNFLRNYLSLVHLYSKQFEYSISAEGDVNRVFIPPLLFIPFVQQSVIQIYKQEKYSSIELLFQVENNQVNFICNYGDGDALNQDHFSRIKQRLDLLYEDNYFLTISKRAIRLRFNIQKL